MSDQQEPPEPLRAGDRIEGVADITLASSWPLTPASGQPAIDDEDECQEDQ